MRNAETGYIVKPQRHSEGYRVYHVKVLKKNFYIHLLVAEAFLGPCPPGKEVNHKNSDRWDCKESNLEYVTRQKNIQHGYSHGYMREKLSPGKALHLRVLAWAGVPRALLAYIFDVSKTTVSHIKHGATWSHI